MGNSRKSASIDPLVAGLQATVGDCIARHVLKGQHVAIALSGGMDSVCLSHVLASLRDIAPIEFQLTAVHVNHGLSCHAAQWEAFCRRLCEAEQILFMPVKVVVERQSKDGLESAARRARHAVLASLEVDWVMLAHHLDDQAETLLFNLIRGAGVSGAGAMQERNGKLLRPLLSIGRDEIECYDKHNGLEWVEDESNTDIRYSRNFLRKNIFPELKKRFPATAKNMAAAAARFSEASDLLDDLARVDLGDACSDFPVSLERLNALDERRARNVLRFLLSQRGVRIPSELRLREGLRQMREAAEDRHPALEFDRHRLFRRRGWIYLEPASAPESR